MRIWSLHPKYLDTKGLVALWRETLLAQSVLQNPNKGYSNHSQLIRFKQCDNKLEAIAYYLDTIWEEANQRGYNFNRNKILPYQRPPIIQVTKGQVKYEINHLLNKLKIRDNSLIGNLPDTITQDILHPLFELVDGNIESWEKV